MRKLTFQRGCFLVIAVCVLAISLRPAWVGVAIVRAPGRLAPLAEPPVPAEDAPATAAELAEAEQMLLMAGAAEPTSGFPAESLNSAVQASRKVRRARADMENQRYARDLAYARAQVPRGWALVGVGAALALLWGGLGAVIWRRPWKSDIASTSSSTSA